MAKRHRGIDSYRKYLDSRGPGDWPCPCCGYRTLHEGPGDYDVCPICFWEDADAQLRWPALTDGPNGGISLLEAQRNFITFGACHRGRAGDTREPKPSDERDPGWRPLDPDIDEFESDPNDPGNVPWPEDAQALYWWRPTYFLRPDNKRVGPAPSRPPSNPAEKMMARILEVAPDTAAIDLKIRNRYEEPAVMSFCTELVEFVVEAAIHGETDLALRIVNELNAGLASGDDYINTCVSVGFLEPHFDWDEDGVDWPPREEIGFRSEELAEFVATWPKEIKAELHRQVAYQEKVRRHDEKLWAPQPDGSYRVTWRWKLRHPILWWKMRHGGIRIAG